MRKLESFTSSAKVIHDEKSFQTFAAHTCNLQNKSTQA